MFLNDILQIKQDIIQQNKTIMNYKEYLQLKCEILINVSYGITQGINYTSNNIYRLVAQTYDRTDREAQREVQRVLTEVDTLRRRQRQIEHYIMTRENEIEQGIISH